MPRSLPIQIVSVLGSGFLLGAVFTCSPSQKAVFEEDPSVDSTDASNPSDPTDMATRPPMTCGAGKACPTDKVCVKDVCVPDRGGCCNDNDCQGDTRCTTQASPGGICGRCYDYGDGDSDPMCIGDGFSATDFKPPVDRCKWPLAGTMPLARDVVMTPIVIDLDLDGEPEIVFAPQGGSGPSRLVAIRGKDCSQVYDVAAGIQNFSQIAAADLDGDKKPEIVGLAANGSLPSGHPVAIFEGTTGRKLAQSSDSFLLSDASYDCSAPAIADVDGDGTPEIAVGAMLLRWDKAAGKLNTLWNHTAAAASWGTATLINDFDGDGVLEICSGNRIYDAKTGADKTPTVMSRMDIGGYGAVGDFNKDGFPDLVFVQSKNGNQKVSVVDVKNDKFLMDPLSIPGGWGGSPTVADFDGDGVPDFGTAAPRYYYVFSLDCLKTPKPAKCRGTLPGVLWASEIKDVSSGGTASSVFDFNGDGRAEVIYRDECWLRVYNGPDGKTVFARPITSGTALEMPIVADVDNDGRADVVVPSDSIQGDGYCSDQNPEHQTGMPHGGVTQGIIVLKDPANRWMPSRPLWNQHTYHITNINDDGTIPASEPPNWKRYNNYRQNVQGKIVITVPQSDVTGRGAPPMDQTDCSKQWKLRAQVCNRGAADIASMMPSTFYSKDPRVDPSTALCTAYTQAPIAPGKCSVISCEWTSPPAMGAVDMWLRANDDGKGGRPQTQCKTDNDLAFLPGTMCRIGPG